MFKPNILTGVYQWPMAGSIISKLAPKHSEQRVICGDHSEMIIKNINRNRNLNLFAQEQIKINGEK